ncbi:DUF4184 family protein [Sphaerisporangium rubeum]|uniref:DUF4184 family protein n=1 Tax=Sphaerisporangium rubeum TaxID=321317 RepID=A0A7X0IIA1_9ACTN|nr:hypothetical protein [Sphaerisporangium rubeum]
MPFTPAHVAAVIPLVRWTRVRAVLDPWALAVGAMVPDLPLFLPYLQDYTGWHTPAGVVTDDLVAVVVLLAVFQFGVRDPLTALLPPSLAGRAAALPGPAWRRFHAVVLGAVAGAATHVLWDSFTHDWGAVFWGWSWLSEAVVPGLPGFRVAQYVSSVLGLAATGWWLVRSLLAAPPGVLPDRLILPAAVRWSVLGGAVVAACGAAAVWTLVDPPNPAFGWAGAVTKTGVGVIVGWCAVITVYVVVWWLGRAMRLRRTAGSPRGPVDRRTEAPDSPHHVPPRRRR